MPLLQKEPFHKAPVPPDLGPDDEVFYVGLTGELFLDYDEFFKRTILLNSLVWTCLATGRTGLTYEEALNSERAAHDSSEAFPDKLDGPLLFLVTRTCRGRIDDLVFDIWSFCRERYLIGEIVEVCYNGSKSLAGILSVKYVGNIVGTSNFADGREQWEMEDDFSDATDEVYASGRRKPKADYRAPPASDYLYEVAILTRQQLNDLDSTDFDECTKTAVTPQEILRRRHLFTKQKCRSFLKNMCEPWNGAWIVRDSAVEEFNIENMDWERDVFGGPIPKFRSTPASRRSVLATTPFAQPVATSKRHQGESSSAASNESTSRRSKRKSQPTPPPVLTEREIKLRQLVERQQHALASLIDEFNRYNTGTEYKILTLDDFVLNWTDVDFNEQLLAEFRERVKKAKDEERERQRDAKRREKEALIEWRKPRDDLQCDDHVKLPDFPQITFPSFLSSKYFGDALALMEFLTSFAEEINLKDAFPVSSDGAHLDLSDMYDMLVAKGTDVEKEQIRKTKDGSTNLMKLLKLLLTQVFRRLAEEEGDEANLDNREDLQHENCDLDHPYYRKIIEEATLASEAVRNTHGMSIRLLPLDNYTLTEIIRLHLSASGYYPGSNPGRFRYQSRGGYRCWDDPGLSFRLRNPDLMERLAKQSIMDLDPVDRLKLLTVLCDQLLTFSSMRTPLQQKTERLQTLRYEIRQLQLNDQKQEREAFAAKIVKQEARAAAILESGQTGPTDAYDPQKPSPFVQRLRKYVPTVAAAKTENGEASTEITYQSINGTNREHIKQVMANVNLENLSSEEIDDVREVQRQIFFGDERRLAEEIYRLQTACGMVTLGRDRTYRKYNLLTSLGAIVVEKSEPVGGECVEEEATPVDRVPETDVSSMSPTEIAILRRRLAVCTGDATTCPVHEANFDGETWYLLNTKETLDELISALNRRGFRESELLENLEFFRPFIEKAFAQCPSTLLLETAEEKWTVCAKKIESSAQTEAALKDAALDLEERLFSGNLGLKGRAREHWRSAFEKDMVQLHPEADKVDYQPSTEDATQEQISNRRKTVVKARSYALHLMDLVRAIHAKGYRKTFVEAHGRYVEGEFIESGSNSLDQWKNSLAEAMSFAQLHLHVASLDNAIAWNKSATQMRCRLCRKKGDVSSFLDCDICERLYHKVCLKAPAKTAPDPVTGRWSCPDCIPNELKKQQQNASSQKNGYSKSNGYQKSDDYDDLEPDEYCEGCQTTLKGSKRRFVCRSCGAIFHPTCAVPSGSSKWTKAEVALWRCDMCASDDGKADVDTDSVASSRRQSSILNGSDAGSESRHSFAAETARRVSTVAKSAEATSTRTGRLVKKPKSLDRTEYELPKLFSSKRLSTTSPRASVNGRSSTRSSVEQEISTPAAAFKRPSVSNVSTPTVLSPATWDRSIDWKPMSIELLSRLCSHPDAWPFLKPVTKKIAPDYHTIIKTPMDLSTVRSKLGKNAYVNPFEFIKDLELLFENCRIYNGPAALVYQCGVRLECYMKEQWETMLSAISPTARHRSSTDKANSSRTTSNMNDENFNSGDSRFKRKRLSS